MTKFQVSIISISQENPTLFLKAIRESTGLSLKDAKDITEFIASTQPCVLVAGIDREVADHIVSLIQEAGVTAIAEESSLTVPLLLHPQANRCYKMNWLGIDEIK